MKKKSKMKRRSSESSGGFLEDDFQTVTSEHSHDHAFQDDLINDVVSEPMEKKNIGLPKNRTKIIRKQNIKVPFLERVVPNRTDAVYVKAETIEQLHKDKRCKIDRVNIGPFKKLSTIYIREDQLPADLRRHVPTKDQKSGVTFAYWQNKGALVPYLKARNENWTTAQQKKFREYYHDLFIPDQVEDLDIKEISEDVFDELLSNLGNPQDFSESDASSNKSINKNEDGTPSSKASSKRSSGGSSRSARSKSANDGAGSARKKSASNKSANDDAGSVRKRSASNKSASDDAGSAHDTSSNGKKSAHTDTDIENSGSRSEPSFGKSDVESNYSDRRTSFRSGGAPMIFVPDPIGVPDRNIHVEASDSHVLGATGSRPAAGEHREYNIGSTSSSSSQNGDNHDSDARTGDHEKKKKKKKRSRKRKREVSVVADSSSSDQSYEKNFDTPDFGLLRAPGPSSICIADLCRNVKEEGVDYCEAHVSRFLCNMLNCRNPKATAETNYCGICLRLNALESDHPPPKETGIPFRASQSVFSGGSRNTPSNGPKMESSFDEDFGETHMNHDHTPKSSRSRRSSCSGLHCPACPFSPRNNPCHEEVSEVDDCESAVSEISDDIPIKGSRKHKTDLVTSGKVVSSGMGSDQGGDLENNQNNDSQSKDGSASAGSPATKSDVPDMVDTAVLTAIHNKIKSMNTDVNKGLIWSEDIRSARNDLRNLKFGLDGLTLLSDKAVKFRKSLIGKLDALHKYLVKFEAISKIGKLDGAHLKKKKESCSHWAGDDESETYTAPCTPAKTRKGKEKDSIDLSWLESPVHVEDSPVQTAPVDAKKSKNFKIPIEAKTKAKPAGIRGAAPTPVKAPNNNHKREGGKSGGNEKSAPHASQDPESVSGSSLESSPQTSASSTNSSNSPAMNRADRRKMAKFEKKMEKKLSKKLMRRLRKSAEKQKGPVQSIPHFKDPDFAPGNIHHDIIGADFRKVLLKMGDKAKINSLIMKTISSFGFEGIQYCKRSRGDLSNAPGEDDYRRLEKSMPVFSTTGVSGLYHDLCKLRNFLGDVNSKYRFENESQCFTTAYFVFRKRFKKKRQSGEPLGPLLTCFSTHVEPVVENSAEIRRSPEVEFKAGLEYATSKYQELPKKQQIDNLMVKEQCLKIISLLKAPIIRGNSGVCQAEELDTRMEHVISACLSANWEALSADVDGRQLIHILPNLITKFCMNFESLRKIMRDVAPGFSEAMNSTQNKYLLARLWEFMYGVKICSKTIALSTSVKPGSVWQVEFDDSQWRSDLQNYEEDEDDIIHRNLKGNHDDDDGDSPVKKDSKDKSGKKFHAGKTDPPGSDDKSSDDSDMSENETPEKPEKPKKPKKPEKNGTPPKKSRQERRKPKLAPEESPASSLREGKGDGKNPKINPNSDEEPTMVKFQHWDVTEKQAKRLGELKHSDTFWKDAKKVGWTPKSEWPPSRRNLYNRQKYVYPGATKQVAGQKKQWMMKLLTPRQKDGTYRQSILWGTDDKKKSTVVKSSVRAFCMKCFTRTCAPGTWCWGSHLMLSKVSDRDKVEEKTYGYLSKKFEITKNEWDWVSEKWAESYANKKISELQGLNYADMLKRTKQIEKSTYEACETIASMEKEYGDVEVAPYAFLNIFVKDVDGAKKANIDIEKLVPKWKALCSANVLLNDITSFS